MKRTVISILLFTLLHTLSPAQSAIESNDIPGSRDIDELLIDIVPDPASPQMNLFGMPKVFMGYRNAKARQGFSLPDTLLTPEIFTPSTG